MASIPNPYKKRSASQRDAAETSTDSPVVVPASILARTPAAAACGTPLEKRMSAPPIAATVPEQPAAKRQKSLHSFFGGTDTTVPQYFCLVWPRQALFLPSLPSELQGGQCLYSKDVEWRDQKKTITLCANVASLEAFAVDGINPVIGRETLYTNASFLKSHLQKCVRRRRGILAMRTALHLMRISMQDFLRRLPIIIIEDAILHRQFPILVWLMVAASKGFVLGKEIIEWLLGLVVLVADGDMRDIAPRTSPSFPLSKVPTSVQDTELKSILYAIQMRRSYGGMAGDMAMLDASAYLWMDRFASTSSKQHTDSIADISVTVQPVDVTSVKPLQVREWELAAIDFHCSNIDSMVLDVAPGVCGGDVGHVRQLIWRFSSSTSRKKTAAYSLPDADDSGESGSDVAEWRAIEPIFKMLAMSILEKSK